MSEGTSQAAELDQAQQPDAMELAVAEEQHGLLAHIDDRVADFRANISDRIQHLVGEHPAARKLIAAGAAGALAMAGVVELGARDTLQAEAATARIGMNSRQSCKSITPAQAERTIVSGMVAGEGRGQALERTIQHRMDLIEVALAARGDKGLLTGSKMKWGAVISLKDLASKGTIIERVWNDPGVSTQRFEGNPQISYQSTIGGIGDRVICATKQSEARFGEAKSAKATREHGWEGLVTTFARAHYVGPGRPIRSVTQNRSGRVVSLKTYR